MPALVWYDATYVVFGVIATGAYADVIAVPGDPLRDIKELGNVQFVMKDGKVFKDDVPKK